MRNKVTSDIARSNEIPLLGRHFTLSFFNQREGDIFHGAGPAGDVSLFIPAQLSSQLVVNMITGLGRVQSDIKTRVWLSRPLH